ncbi:unnamed protein product, partial [Brassica rapa]
SCSDFTRLYRCSCLLPHRTAKVCINCFRFYVFHFFAIESSLEVLYLLITF